MPGCPVPTAILSLIPVTEMIVQDDRAGHKVTEVTAAVLEAQDLVSFFYKLLSLWNHLFLKTKSDYTDINTESKMYSLAN